MKLFKYYISFLFLRYIQIRERYPELLLDTKRFCAWDPFILLQLSPHTINSLKPFSSYVNTLPNPCAILILFLEEIRQNLYCLISLLLYKSLCVSSKRWVSNKREYNNVLLSYFRSKHPIILSESGNIGFVTLSNNNTPHYFKRISSTRRKFLIHFLGNEQHWQKYLEQSFGLRNICTANDIKSFLIFLKASSSYNIRYVRFFDLCLNFIFDLVNLPLRLFASLKVFSVKIISTCLWNMNNTTVDLLIDLSSQVDYFGCQHGARYFEANDPLHEMEIQFPLFTDFFSFGLRDPVISPSLILQRQLPSEDYDVLLVQSSLIHDLEPSENFLKCIESLIKFSNILPSYKISVRLHPKQSIDIVRQQIQILFPKITSSVDIFDPKKTCGISIHFSTKSIGIAPAAKIVIFDHPLSTLFWYIDEMSPVKKILCYDQANINVEVNPKYYNLYDTVLTNPSLLLSTLRDYSNAS